MQTENRAVNGKRRAIERDVIINGTHIRIRSIFTGTIPLEKALANIAKRKLAIAREMKEINDNS